MSSKEKSFVSCCEWCGLDCSPLSSFASSLLCEDAAILAKTAQPQGEEVLLRDLHNFLFF